MRNINKPLLIGLVVSLFFNMCLVTKYLDHKEHEEEMEYKYLAAMGRISVGLREVTAEDSRGYIFAMEQAANAAALVEFTPYPRSYSKGIYDSLKNLYLNHTKFKNGDELFRLLEKLSNNPHDEGSYFRIQHILINSL
ncbi:hypothetical protein [Paenibacillus lutrae]|uniref:Uncharacterized protein n=1 Tax=Paenibacillus lutrae TaxID=2078573 RepID=A0A7X3JYV1_9BACL|nr:hypothetical protein [Paenibacillus lutrae]MVO99528.1 hypothetical protein [Paenibacillus lutrae]